MCHGQLHGSGKANDQGSGEGACAQGLFLPSTPLQRLELESLTNYQCTDAFGAVELVGAEADQIKAETIRL